MAHKRSETLTALPAEVHPEQRLTFPQACQLAGRGRSRFYSDMAAGRLPPPCERDGRFVRWRAADLIEALRRLSEAA